MKTPTPYEISVWKRYTRLTDKYIEKLAGDETLSLAQKYAIEEVASIEETDEEDVKRMIDDVCNWLMKGTNR